MAGQKAILTTDVDSVLKMFAAMDNKNQKKVHRRAIRSSLAVLTKETKKNFRRVVKNPRSRNWWNGKPLASGIRVSVNKEATEGRVDITGDFRLRFFELGTRYRRTTGRNRKRVRGKIPKYRQKKKSNRGSISPGYFFRRARAAKESEISRNLNQAIEQSIIKVNEQFRNR